MDSVNHRSPYKGKRQLEGEKQRRMCDNESKGQREIMRFEDTGLEDEGKGHEPRDIASFYYRR